MADDSKLEKAFNTLGDAINDASDWIDDAVARLDLVEWAMIGLGLLLFWRVWVISRTSGQLGPIAVADLAAAPAEGTPPSTPDVKGLTAQMRERLASAGALIEPELPAGRPALDLEAVVKASPVPQAAWVASIVGFIQALLRRFTGSGFRVEGTLQTRPAEPTHGITVALSHSATGALYKMRTFWSQSHESAAESAAFWLYVEVVDAQKSQALSAPSQTWTDPEALRLYREGADLESRTPQEALDRYRESAQLEDRNIVPRLAIANVCERLAATAPRGAGGEAERSATRERLLEALALYQSTAYFWSDELESRYRLANLCSFKETWEFAWNGITAESQQLSRLEGLVGALSQPTVEVIVSRMLDRSAGEFEELRARIGSDNPQRVKMVEVAELCTKVLLKPSCHQQYATQLSADLKSDCDWLVRYNAACFFTLAFAAANSAANAATGDAATKLAADEYMHSALGELHKVVQDPLSALPLNWLAHEDPDLQLMREWVAANAASASTHKAEIRAWNAVFAVSPVD
jgi:hypothetical protein